MTRARYLFRKLPIADGELEKLADELGVSRSGTVFHDSERGMTTLQTYELQRRIRETIRDFRDSLLWLLALISALASLVSAVAAWRAAAH